jgi:hypothetical protein
MENFKQIVYRNEDDVLVIVPTSENVNTKVNFLNELDSTNLEKLNALKNLCIEKIPAETFLKYVVSERGTNILNVEHSEGVIQINIMTLNSQEQTIVSDSINVCIELLNS